ncbi:dihydropteroate synthase [Pedobacter sp. UYP30]|uniref:dihydropteroate synthase n=1 Tax=Pedobacter sp. UYP30 TaxID=1756400 RepID=UPI00339B748F
MMREKKTLDSKKSLNLNGKIISLETPKVMGILNLTPDSFFAASRTTSANQILKKVDQFLNEGATFIDIGGYSSRPKAENISTAEEIERVIDAITLIVKHFPEAILSIDTFRAEVAAQAVNAGAHLINDISAGTLDEKMFATVAKFNVPYIMMHIQGTPQTMQEDPYYKNVVLDVLDFFVEKTSELHSLGVKDIIIDPGFGFGKTLAHNYTLLRNLDDFKILGLPVMAGLSRKGMVYNPLKTTAQQALNGTSILNTIALQNGASILRVHDVKEAVECVQLMKLLTQS